MSAGGNGFVFAATGDLYVHLVRRTARNLRAVAPEAQIDLFTDRALTDPVFSRIHQLDRATAKPKMEALRRTRFERTLYLDADIVAFADPSDLFCLLERADIVGVHEQYGNSRNRVNRQRPDIPQTFREINSGVLGVTRSGRMETFLRNWEAAFARAGGFDQPVLREMLWDDPDIRLCVAPVEYNLMHVRLIRSYGRLMAAPRLLHVTRLHQQAILLTDPETPVTLAETMTEKSREAFMALIENDRTLGAMPSFASRMSEMLDGSPRIQAKARKVFRWLSNWLG